MKNFVDIQICTIQYRNICAEKTRVHNCKNPLKKMQYMFRCRLPGDGSLKLASNLTWWPMPISVDRFSQSGRQWFLHNCFKKISRISEYKLRERERERESGYSITVSKKFLALANTNWERERDLFALWKLQHHLQPLHVWLVLWSVHLEGPTFHRVLQEIVL